MFTSKQNKRDEFGRFRIDKLVQLTVMYLGYDSVLPLVNLLVFVVGIPNTLLSKQTTVRIDKHTFASVFAHTTLTPDSCYVIVVNTLWT